MSLLIGTFLLIYITACALHIYAACHAPPGYQDATGFHPSTPSHPMPETPAFPPPAFRPPTSPEAPQRNYFCTVIDDATGSVAYAGEFKSPIFTLALEQAWTRARRRCPAGLLRVTSVVEQPDISVRGPISIALEITRHQSALAQA